MMMIVSAPPRRRRRRRRRGSTAESRPATLPARSAAGNGHRRGCAFGQPCPSHSTSYSGSTSKSARGRHFRSDRLSTKSRRVAAQSVVPHDRHRRWSGGDRGTNRMLPAKPHRFSHGSCRAYSMAVIQRIATVAERPLCADCVEEVGDPNDWGVARNQARVSLFSLKPALGRAAGSALPAFGDFGR
jgi:hypothetical protein